MIISASRRTDIPAYYSQWLFRRLKEGYALVRNPVNFHQVSRISLTPDAVDGIVFWTKNPIPMLDDLHRLRDYAYYFQFTINAYGTDVEPRIPSKRDFIIPAFQKLSQQIGPHRVVWRYDPVFLSETYSPEYHIHYFEQLAKRLSPHTETCVISFLDTYRNTEDNMAGLGMRAAAVQEMRSLAGQLAEIAKSYGLKMQSCAEDMVLEEWGIARGRCVDGQLFERILQRPLRTKKDPNQRPECGCVESLDLGAYNTCRGGCRYCYACFDERTVRRNTKKHDPRSPLLVGEVEAEDRVVQKKMESCVERQIKFTL